MTYFRKEASPEVVSYHSAHLTYNNQPNKIKSSYGTEKRDKKDIQVRDLAPKKDAKGGARSLDGANSLDGGSSLDKGGSLDGGSSLDKGGSLDGGRSLD